MKRKIVRYAALAVALSVVLLALVVPQQVEILIGWPKLMEWNAKRLGSNQAAAEASNGKFEFVAGSTSISATQPFYPGTKDCLLPAPDLQVTDWVFAPGESDLAAREDAFALAHNRYLIGHFARRMSPRCRHRANGS